MRRSIPAEGTLQVLRDLDAHAVGVGTTYDTRGWMPGKSKAYLNHVTITAYEPGKRFAFDALDPKGGRRPQ